MKTPLMQPAPFAFAGLLTPRHLSAVETRAVPQIPKGELSYFDSVTSASACLLARSEQGRP
jgi:hypothetical protein